MMNDPRIDFRLVEALAMLISERSVTLAANRLNISQPAMSHNLSKLRKIFEDPILTRGRGGLVPTARALELGVTAREILDGVARLTAPTPKFNPKLSETTFVLTATEYTEYVLAGGLMAELRVEAPHARMIVRPPDRQLMMGWLERGEVDIRLGWVYEPEPVLRTAPLFEEKLVVIARRGHPQINGRLTLQEYLGSMHVNSEVAGSRTTGKAITEALGRLAGKIEIGLQVQNALTIPHAVAA